MAMAINLDFFAQTITVGSITAIWWIQLSTAIISGLAFSTFLTLILIPVMLSLPTNVVNLFSRTQTKAETQTQSEVAMSEPTHEVITVEVDDETNVTPMPNKKKTAKKAGKPKSPPSDDVLEAAE
jgi:hypothetical protein